MLEDYADVAEGLLALHAVTGEPAWLEVAGGLLDTVLAHFSDGAGGFYDTPDDATDPALVAVRRPQDPTDNAYPSGLVGRVRRAAVVCRAHRVGAAPDGGRAGPRGRGRERRPGRRAPSAGRWRWPRRSPTARARSRWWARTATSAAPPCTPSRSPAWRPGWWSSVGEAGDGGVPLLADRPLVAERPTAYVCRSFVCQAPVTEPAALAVQVGAALSLRRTRDPDPGVSGETE